MKSLPRTASHGFTAAALCLVAWVAFTLVARPLMLPDEGRYVGVAWEMLRSGEWLTPTLNGLPYFHKPPLFYWITATSLWLFGQHEWAARVASLLGAALGATAMYAFTRQWSSERATRASLVVLLAQPLWLIGGQFANLDMLVAGCISATIVLLAHAVLLADHGKRWRAVLMGAWAMAALGVLAKGLIGFVLPAMVIFVWLVLRRRWRSLFSLLWWPGILIFLALTAPWFVAMQQRFPDFLDYFFVVQHFKRFAQGGFNNVMPFWFYPVVLCASFLPWLPWLVRAVRRKAADESDTQQALRLLMLVWPMLVVGFFSLPQSKLLGYVLPAVPPLAFIVADGFLSKVPLSRGTLRLWWGAAGLASVLSLGTLTWLATHPTHANKSTQDFAGVLKAQRSPEEPIVMLDSYYFDLPFYARLTAPVTLVQPWDDPQLHRQDSQRKELADAGQFDKAAAADRLLLPDALPALLCGSATTWVLGPTSAQARYPFLEGATDMRHHNGATLWRVDRSRPAMASALGCA